MSRPIAILLAVLLFGLVIVEAATEQTDVPDIDSLSLILNVIAQVFLAFGLFAYCGFAALHATQRIDSPQDRSMWLVATVVLNVLGSCWYYVTTYQSFRRAGQGRLMRFKKTKHA